MTVLAQAVLAPTDFPWAAISPELVLFGVGLLALLLDTAGRERLQASFVVFGVVAAGAGTVAFRTGEFVLPGLVVLAGLVQLLLTAIWRDRPRTLGATLAALGFAGGLATTGWQWVVASDQGLVLLAGQAGEPTPLVGTASLLEGMFVTDGVALFTRATVCLAGLITIPLGFAYAEQRRIHRGEYYPLLLFAATGMTLLAAAGDLIMVFIAIEVLSLSLYILTGFAKRDLASQEGALKYFLLGAFASAILLYGVALVYGVTGNTNIAEAGRVMSGLGSPTPLVLTGMALLIVGLAFKTSLVPFHMWIPDVYQGAPTTLTGFMAATTKAAAFAAFLRIFVGALAPLQWSWQPAVGVLAALTMIVGAVIAVAQVDLKRMLGYSAVAHGGYMALGVVTSSRDGTSALLLYAFLYAVTVLGAFGVLALMELRVRKALVIADLRGMGRRYPVPCGMFALFLLSLAGIPGTAGFWAKFAVFSAAVDEGFVGLVVIAVVSSIIAAGFYIRVTVAMFMEEEPETAPAFGPLPSSPGNAVGLAATAAGVVVLGVRPDLLVDLAARAASFAG